MNAQAAPSAARKVSHVRQAEVAECGLASLAMVAGAFGIETSLPELRRRFGTSIRGNTVDEIIAMGAGLGIELDAYSLDLEHLSQLRLPAMLHWDMNHYVVLERIKGERLLIQDPARDARWIDLAEFRSHFTGVAVQVESVGPTPKARDRSAPRLRLRQLLRDAPSLRSAFVKAIVLTVAMQAFLVVTPYYMQISVDRAIPERNPLLLLQAGILFGLFALANGAATFQRSLALLSAGTRLSHSLTARIGLKLVKLPIEWYERRQVADILSRLQSVGPIQRILTEGAVGALLDSLLVLAMVAIMLAYDATLTLIPIGAFAAYGLLRSACFKLQRQAQEDQIAAAAGEQGTMIETLRGIRTLRLHAREEHRHSAWENKLRRATNATVRLRRIEGAQLAMGTVIFGVENVLVIGIAAAAVLAGESTVGMLFAYMLYKQQFATRAAALLDRLLEFRMTGLHLDRLGEIALADDDVSHLGQVEERRDLAGDLRLDDVHYSYGPNQPAVLGGISLHIAPGSHVAITGRSGSGKTTLAKVLLGLVEPSAGRVLVDGVDLAEYGHRNYHSRIAGVLQEDCLFSGSIAQNIALFEENADPMRIIEAAQLAAIHDDIAAMPMGYDSPIGDMGSSLSGGQLQRVLLARALYRRPAVLVMDEGTAHLDADTEAQVNANLKALGMTRVVIAHRRETIAAADAVHEMRDGRLTRIR